MPRLTFQLPAYRRHAASGKAIVTLNGRDFYLGVYGSPESKAEYERLIQEWLVGHRCVAPRASGYAALGDPKITVNHLIAAFWDFAQTYYVKNGHKTTELQAIKYACKPLAELYGRTPACEFSPRALKAVRQRMIDQDFVRTLINRRVTRIRHIFKWGIENEMVPPSILEGLRAVAPLKRGRCEVREADPVRPAPVELINPIQPHVSRQVWTMVQLQLLTGMRSGEVTIMRLASIDTTEKVWAYTPESHKTEHHGHVRRVYLGPQAQQLLAPFMKRRPETYLFSPNEADKERREKLSAIRKTPLSCGNVPGSHCAKRPRKKPGRRYTTSSYLRAITYACDKAFPWPKMNGRPLTEIVGKEREEYLKWRKEHRWHPHQLRHSAATYLRKKFGIEAARLILGHRSAAITEVYAEMDHQKAQDIMAQEG